MMAIKSLERRQSERTIAWFRDLRKRGLLNLDPPYQRRSVWNDKYREFFVETVLLHYPAPPIFLNEEIRSDGSASYAVIDGKQRLRTVFDFADDLFPVAGDSVLERFQGLSFFQLGDDVKKSFWSYEFLVEFIPTTDEGTLNNIFDRINRNVARLTRQELRHARFDGDFASAAEDLNDLLALALPEGVPRIARTSRRQMKDIELTAQLLLLAESGPQSFSQDELDQAYSDRDEEWEARTSANRLFQSVVDYLAQLWSEPVMMAAHMRRLRNQADFYSLFGAVAALLEQSSLPSTSDAAERLERFVAEVNDEEERELSPRAERFYQAARSASNDARQRVARIEIIREVLGGIEVEV
jgi:hypothetical protein